MLGRKRRSGQAGTKAARLSHGKRGAPGTRTRQALWRVLRLGPSHYGTPAGSIMCTGAYMLKSWTALYLAPCGPAAMLGPLAVISVPVVALQRSPQRGGPPGPISFS